MLVTLHKAQREIVESPDRFRVLLAGRRFGKSVLAIEELIFNALTIKTARVCYIAPTYQSARDIAWDILKNRLLGINAKINDSRLEIEINGSKIMLRSWENVDTLRGQYFDFMVLDEVAQYKNFWLNWQEVIRPCLTDRRGRVLFISTPLGFNHFYDLYTNSGYKTFHFTSYDNPHIPKEEIDKAKEEMTEDRFAQEYMADFRKTEGLVYKEFDRNRHVTEESPKTIVKVMAGIDWGWTNPATVYRVREDSDRHYWIDNEFYKIHQTTDQIIEYTKLLKPEMVYPDPAEPDRNEQARTQGLNVREVSKDIEAGIATIQELLKQNRIHIHPDCKNLIHEFETYHYPERKPDQNEKETPVKENDHGLDNIRYILHNQTPTIEEPIDYYYQNVGTHYRD
jgi:PBSX family phage terminase large subunit